MAALVECPSLRRTHGGGVVSDVGGWGHGAYREAMHEAEARAECDEDRWVSLGVGQKQVSGSFSL